MAGIDVAGPIGSGHLKCKGMLLLCTTDLPARASVANMKNFSGEYGCSTCTDKGDNTLGSTPLHRVWPVVGACSIRSERAVKKSYVKAARSGTAVSLLHNTL